MGTVIGVDLGGTNVLAAGVSNDGEASGHIKRATPTGGAEEVMDIIVEMVREIDEDATAVGIGVPGPVSNGVVIEAPNLAGWDEPVDVSKILTKRLKIPVTLGNDANVGTLGEARHGAGAGAVNGLGCWLGTGVGGGLIINGRLFEGTSGAAGELGHVPVEMTTPRKCGCGRWGCVEAYAGRASMTAMVDRLQAEGGTTAMYEIMKKKGKDRFTSSVWNKALKEKDEVATAIVDESVTALGMALAGMINTLDLDTVIFGGGLAEKLGQSHVDRIEEVTLPRLMAPDVERRWVVASLGDDSGVVGAAELARSAATAV